MMKTTTYIAAMIAMIALAGCQQEVTTTFATDPDAIHIQATVGATPTGATTAGAYHKPSSNPIADGGADPTKFNTGDRIKVETDDQEDVIYTYDGTRWLPEDGKYLKWNKDQHHFYATSPAGYFDLQRDQSTIEGLRNSDLMFADTVLTKSSARTASLHFKRNMARVVISKTIDWGTQYDNARITELYVHAVANNFIITPYSGTDNYYAIVFAYPDALPNDTFLTIHIQAGTEAITHTITGIPLHEAGKSYTYELKIGKDKAEIGSVTIQDWQNANIVDENIDTEAAPDYRTSIADGITTYHIYTAKGLQEVNALLTAPNVTAATLKSNLSLECNITLPTPAEGESNWTPIGNTTTHYTGTFLGNGYTLTGLTINAAAAYQGLIAYLGAGGAVKHLTLADCTIKGTKYVGAFVARASDGSLIQDCHLQATTGKATTVETVEDRTVGGIVGIGYSKIAGCSLTTDGGSVTVKSKSSRCGGIVGDGNYENSEQSGFLLSRCFVSATNNGTITIHGTDCTGGMIGTVAGTDPHVVGVQDCHITNSGGTIIVTGREQVGGAVGRIWKATVQNCDVAGVQVTGSSMVGGLAGSNGQLWDEGYIVGSNSVKDCTITGTDPADADYVHWDIGWNIHETQDPAILDGGNNQVIIDNV